MKTMPGHEYGGYTIVANALPAPQNRYYSTFSIHESSPGKTVFNLPLVYQQGFLANVTCNTAEQAHEEAFARAHSWIDANPLS